jgi:hypothetical protein
VERLLDMDCLIYKGRTAQHHTFCYYK